MTRSIRRTISFLACTTFLPLLVMGCPKKEPVVEDAGAPPPPAPPPSVTELAPLVDDAGPDAADAEVDAGKKLGTGPIYNPNQAKIKACCNAMRAQAKTLGASPEAFQITTLAAQCDVLATQIGPGGTAPELAQVRAMLKSVNLPAACQ